MEQSPSSRRARRRPGAFRPVVLLRAIVAVAFVAGVYLAGRLGVEMARERLPDDAGETASLPEETSLSLGQSGDPLYLGESPGALRRFFADHPTAESRARADLDRSGIRRLSGTVEMTTLRSEADATQVRLSSGPIAGTEYWIHHTQLPDATNGDPIISPLPGDPSSSPNATKP